MKKLLALLVTLSLIQAACGKQDTGNTSKSLADSQYIKIDPDGTTWTRTDATVYFGNKTTDSASATITCMNSDKSFLNGDGDTCVCLDLNHNTTTSIGTKSHPTESSFKCACPTGAIKMILYCAGSW